MQPAASPASGSSGRERPRFRQDLIAELIEAPGARFIDVMAPDSGNMFRFYEAEYSLACGMDGERDVPGIAKWAQDELGLSPSLQEVRAVIATLGELGFIDGAEGAEAAAPAPERAPAAAALPPARSPASPRPEVGPPAGRPVRSTPPAPLAPAAGTEGATTTPAAPAIAAAGASAPRSTARPTPALPAEVVPGASAGRPTRPTPPASRVVEPAVVEPAVVEPAVVEPAVVEPAVVEPAVVEPAVVEPAAPPEISAISDASAEVSVDLSDHMAVRPDDVKEAVRASRVMAAVEPPPDVLEMIPEEPTARGLAAEPEFDVPSDPGFELPESPLGPESAWGSESARALETLGAESAPLPETRIGKPLPGRQPAGVRPPVELPQPPLPVEQPLPPMPRKGNPALIVVLVLVILGAGAFVVWKYVLGKTAPGAQTSATLPVPETKPPPPPPPPPAPTAKIGLETPPPDELKLLRVGVIENVLPDKTVVKEGDVVVRLVGDKPLEAELGALNRDQKRLQDLIDLAAKRRDAAAVAGNKAVEAAAQTEISARQKTLAAKQNQLATTTAELDNYLLHAPGDGMFSPAVKPGQKVAAAAVAGAIQRDAIPVATFKVANATAFAANASVEVAVGNGEQRVTCTIADVQPDSVKVTCPADPALTEGADVTLNAPAATAPGAPAEPAATPPGTGVAPAGAPPPVAPATTPPSGGSAPAPGAPPAQ